MIYTNLRYDLQCHVLCIFIACLSRSGNNVVRNRGKHETDSHDHLIDGSSGLGPAAANQQTPNQQHANTNRQQPTSKQAQSKPL
eukprot:6487307-Amphidinium_carterae.1